MQTFYNKHVCNVSKINLFTNFIKLKKKKDNRLLNN